MLVEVDVEVEVHVGAAVLLDPWFQLHHFIQASPNFYRFQDASSAYFMSLIFSLVV